MRTILAVVLVLTNVACASEPAVNASPVTRPAMPYVIRSETRNDPPMRLWSVQIDLKDPRTKVQVLGGGEDPDGPGEWQTTLAPVPAIVEKNDLDLAVNASFFGVDKTGQWAGKGYTANQPAKANGWTMTDGKKWSDANPEWPVLWIDANNRAHLSTTADVKNATQVVAGNAWILRDGKSAVPEKGMMTVKHPRTAVGVNADGTLLTLLIVDGRQPGVSIGMTGEEMRVELEKLGCVNAINLDGGGSTTLVERDAATDEPKIINRPSDGRPRPVANVVGVKVED